MIALKLLGGALVAVIVAHLVAWWVQSYEQAREAGAVRGGPGDRQINRRGRRERRDKTRGFNSASSAISAVKDRQDA